MLWNREEYLSMMTFEGAPRPMFTELFGPLIGLEDEWRAQGASQDEISLRAFGWDAVNYANAGISIKPITGIAPRVLIDNTKETISIDAMGRKMRLCKDSATIPLPMSHVVETPDDWARVRDWYRFNEARVDINRLKTLAQKQKQGMLIIADMPGGFDEPRQLMGEENLCYAYYDEPEMIKDMLDTMADMCVHVFERALNYITIDVLCVHEDMAGKSGPLVGERQIDEFIAPYYQKIWSPLRAAGAKLFSQDSDGDMTRAIDAFLRAGVNVMYPAEPRAGMDIQALRAKYGRRLAFKGGIDKFALRGSKQDIERELTYKMSGGLLDGGMAFALDHRIPNGVTIENYRYYVCLGREILGLPPANPSDFVRMAF